MGSKRILSLQEKFLVYALYIGACELVPEGRKLKSGRISPIFFNSGLFSSGKKLAHLIDAYVVAAMHEKFECDVVFGPAYKGIPLATAFSLALSRKFDKDVGYAFNRKEAKDHGEGGTIIGASLEGKKVVIIDDVMTTGTSSGEAVEIIRANVGNPVSVVIAFDRQERGTSNLSAVQEFEKTYKIPVRAAAKLENLISLLKEWTENEGDQGYGKALKEILAYREKYGVAV